MVERITDRNNMLVWAEKAQSYNGDNKRRCDLQDVFMRSTQETLHEVYNGLDQGDLAKVSCSIGNILGQDTLWDFIQGRAKTLVRKERKELYAEYETYQQEQEERRMAKELTLLDKMRMLAEQEKELAKREEVIPGLESKITYLQGRIQELSQRINTLREYEEKANKYDELRKLLA